MTATTAALVESAVELACRAPSYHNSQPWRWVLDGGALQLHVDADRLVATDRGGRQAVLSCGAALHHLRVAMEAAGHATDVDYYPDAADLRHVASLRFRTQSDITAAQRRRADAILARRSDRLPFAAPTTALEPLLRDIAGTSAAVDVIGADRRAELAEAAALSEQLRLYDSAYHAEMDWWTAAFEVTDGIPHSALVSAAESDRVDVGRSFPVTRHTERRPDVVEDQATILVVSAASDTPREVLGCGETLSAILLEATAAGLATCTLTHVTEVAVSRDIVAALTGRPLPQVLVRIGVAPALEPTPPPTPRRPLSDVLHFSVG